MPTKQPHKPAYLGDRVTARGHAGPIVSARSRKQRDPLIYIRDEISGDVHSFRLGLVLWPDDRSPILDFRGVRAGSMLDSRIARYRPVLQTTILHSEHATPKDAVEAALVKADELFGSWHRVFTNRGRFV